MNKTRFRSRTRIVLDKPRAKHVLRPLYRTYKGQQQLFAYITYEENAPHQIFFPLGVEKGSIWHRCWLFFVVMTDTRSVSYLTYESHVRLWEKAPQLYSKEVLGMSFSEILKILAREKIRIPKLSAEYWQRSAETLFGSFGGDPLIIYSKLGSVDNIVRFSNSGRGNQNKLLPGFGSKILSLLALFYNELGLMPTPNDAFPVDVHVQRFALATGIVTGIVSAEAPTVRSYEIERVLRPLLCEVCMEEHWKPLDLSHALRFLGNRCCSGCYRKSAVRTLCPSYEMCGGAPSTLLYNRKGAWDLAAPRHRKGGDCSFNLPSSPMFP